MLLFIRKDGLTWKNLNNIFLKTVAALLSFVAISSVNSACAVIFGQEKEPDSLAKYKKY